MKNLLAIGLLLLLSETAGIEQQQQNSEEIKPSLLELDNLNLPQNTVAEVGRMIVLNCAANDSIVPHNIQWVEYAYSSTGNLISDNGVLLDHPQAARYRILTRNFRHYDLQIFDLTLADGGVYMCQDVQASPDLKRQHSAALTVIDLTNNYGWCNGSPSGSGWLMEGSNHTNTCSFNFKGPIVPNITWSGIEPFQLKYFANDTTVWSEMNYTVTRDKENSFYECTVYISDYFLPVDANFASNVPEVSHTCISRYVYAAWGVETVQICPVKPRYYVGDILYCFSDAFPPPSYYFKNLLLGDGRSSQTLVIEEHWRGYNQTVQCEAYNNVEGREFTVTSTMVVDMRWFPKDVKICPIKPKYYVGDVLFCSSDSDPENDVQYIWENHRTFALYEGQTLKLDESWRGTNQSLSCTASNRETLTITVDVDQNFGDFVSDQLQGDEELKPILQELDYNHLPLNTVATVSSTVVLRCAVLFFDVRHHLQWIEFAHSGGGRLISDNRNILNHPEAARYKILYNDNFYGYYDLQISNVTLADGGVYMCQDVETDPALKRQHAAALTVIEIAPNGENCNSTIPEGIMLEGSPQTCECSYNFKGPIAPNMTWAGAQPFEQNYIASENSIWNKMEFNAARQMDTRVYYCTINFTDYFLPVQKDFASNIPDFVYTHLSNQMFIQWGPQEISIYPIEPLYEVGDLLSCRADAFPAATFTFENLRTGEIYENDVSIEIRVEESWRGFNQSVKCEATNTINGVVYTDSITIAVDVAAITK